jgi:hypothetical protein
VARSVNPRPSNPEPAKPAALRASREQAMNYFTVGGKFLGTGILVVMAISCATSQADDFGKRKTYVAISISGTPSTTDVAGTTYSFKPSTTGGRTGTTSFSITNKPAWASFSISNGTLSGTPSANQTGTYANVTIQVTDGTTSATLTPFSISVTAPLASTATTSTTTTTGSASLNWTAPSQNTDGSPLTDLAGYTVYYGSSPTSMTNKVVVASATTTSYTVGSLPKGTYYFGLTALTSTGIESALSNIGSKTIN